MPFVNDTYNVLLLTYLHVKAWVMLSIYHEQLYSASLTFKGLKHVHIRAPIC
jgi:hypothetical protein